MKANEIINEAPALWDKVTGGIAGWKAGGQQNAGAADAAKSAAVSIKQWNELVGQKKAAGVPVTPEDLAGFIKKQAGTANIPPPADVNNAKQVSDYINKAVAQHIANTKTGTGAAPAAQAPAAPAQQPAAAKAEPVKINGQTLDPKDPAAAKIIAQVQAQDAAGAQKPAEPRTPTPTPSQVMQSFRSLEPEEQTDTLARLTKAYGGTNAAQPATAAEPTDAFAAKRAAGAAAAQASMTPKPAAVAAPAPAKPAANFAQTAGKGYASQTTNAPVAATPTIQQRPNLGPGKAASQPSEQDLTKQALDARRKQGLMASKENKKPSIAEMKKLKNKLIVKEMALAKAKRDKGII
jgi:hypothetical protein